MTTFRTKHLLDHDPHTVHIVRWNDPVVERLGHDALGDYVETFWLGTLGPTATWLLRRFAAALSEYPEGCTIDLPSTAGALGLGWEDGRANPFVRSLERLLMFGLAQANGDRLEVRTVVPPLAFKQIARLPEHLRYEHEAWMNGSRREGVAVAACGYAPTLSTSPSAMSVG
jgi:hypothetical protein